MLLERDIDICRGGAVFLELFQPINHGTLSVSMVSWVACVVNGEVRVAGKFQDIIAKEPGYSFADSKRQWIRHLENDRSVTQFARDKVFGRIVWSRSLGRPLSASLSMGFQIAAGTTKTILVGTPGSGVAVEKTIEDPREVFLKDGQSDSEHYQVNFIVPGVQVGKNEWFIRPDFSASGWTDPGIAALLAFSPAEFTFTRTDEGLYYMEFSVIDKRVWGLIGR